MKKSELIKIIKEEIASLLLEKPEAAQKTEQILAQLRQDLADAKAALRVAQNENDSEAINKASTRVTSLEDQIKYYEEDSFDDARS